MSVLKVKVGIIGTGLIAQLMHIPYVREISTYDLCAICDANKNLVKTVGQTYSIPKVYTDHLEMLRKENLDAVVVCVPDEYHDQVCVDASEAGCHVLVEKPMALSVKATERMINAAKKASRLLMLGYMKRYDPAYEVGASLIQKARNDVNLIRVHDFAGGFGPSSMSEVLHGMTKRDQIPLEKQAESEKRTRILLKEQLGGYNDEEESIWRTLLGLGTHDMTVLRGAFGDPKRVIVTTTVPGLGSAYPGMKIIGMTVLSILDYGKAKCVFEIGGPQRTWFDQELVAYGHNQTISIRFPYPWIKNEPTTLKVAKARDGGFEENKITCSYQESFKQEHIHFLECIQEDKEPRTPGIEGKKDLEYLYEILKANEKN